MADVTVKICDRCKKEIKDRRGIAVYEPIFIRSILSLDLFRRSRYGWPDRFDKRQCDLCEDCSNKLVWFLEGAELDLGENPEETGEAAVEVG
jgi:hypothetical protein